MGYNLNLQKIFNKIPKDKIELQKIELSLTDDFKKQINIFKEFNSTSKKLIADVNKTSKNSSKSWDKIVKQNEVLKKSQLKASKLVDDAEFLQDDIIEAANALGVNYQAVQGYQELDKIWDKAGDLVFKADEQLGNIKRA
jgi:hypothetical protein